ncbi:MAG: nitroreductase/quinone reductase family protein [Marmoricola sp.]
MSLYLRLLTTHAAIYERTGGLLGHRLLGVPTILLQTTGRKSGLQRSSALKYAVDDRNPERLLIVASNGGADRPPAWLLNLTANSDVNVQLRRKNYPATATAIYPGEDDYDRLITLCDADNRGRYSRYRSMTERPIPVVALTPR